jgi:hypothetical protein
MTSHVVDYKLCDKSFDCEHCEFDNVMRNRARAESLHASAESPDEGVDIIDRLLDELVKEHQNKRSIYLPNNLVLDELSDRSYRLSLSSLAIRFMDNVYSVVPCRPGERIRKGQACVTLSGAWGGMTVTSPIHFLFQDKSYDGIELGPLRGVIGFIQSEKSEIERERVSQQEWQKQVIGLTRKLVQMKSYAPDNLNLSKTRMRNYRFLYQRIGKDNYFELMNFLFKQKIRARTV